MYRNEKKHIGSGVLGVLVVCGAAGGATISWTGSGADANFTTAGNWSVTVGSDADSIPDSDDLVVFGSTPVNKSVVLGAARTVDALRIDDAGYTFNTTGGQFRTSNVTINAGNYTFGNIRTEASGHTQLVTVADGLTLTAGSDLDNGVLSKQGSGKMIVTAFVNTQGLIVDAGILDVRAAFTPANATNSTRNALISGSGGTITNTVTGGSNTKTLTLGSKQTSGGVSFSASYAGSVQGNLSLVLGATGGSTAVDQPNSSQTFSGANSYTGTTIVRSGRLFVNNSHTGGGNYTVNGTTANVAINGHLSGNHTGSASINIGTNSFTIGDGVVGATAGRGVLSPGATADSVGTLALAGSALNFSSDGVYEASLLSNGATDAADLVKLTGNLGINALSTLDLVGLTGFSAADFFDGETYTLMTFTGTRTGAFVVPTDDLALLAANNYELAYTSNDLRLQPVPEPATLGLLASAGLLALRRRRVA